MYTRRKFLSTLSLRRATTIFAVRPYDAPIFLSTLSLRRATQDKHHPQHGREFLSTLSLRRATAQHFSTLHNIFISIHALLAESDCYSLRYSASRRHFYPRSPCGERRMTHTQKFCASTFLSTLSLRRATGYRWQNLRQNQFLSTLSLRRATLNSSWISSIRKNFYPRSPCGERRVISV